MSSDDKAVILVVTAICLAVISLIVCITVYEVTTTQAAIEAGLEQRIVGNSKIWAKPGSQP